MPFKVNAAAWQAPTMESLEREIDELGSLPPEDPGDSRWELVRHAVREAKDTHFVLALCDDVSFPGIGATPEEQWMSLLEKPELCAKAAELQGRRMLREVAVFAALGVDGIMPCGDLGSSSGLLASPEIFRSMVLPWNRAHVAAAHRHGLKVLKHCCGRVWDVIDELADTYDAYEGIQASGGMDIRLLKERVGDRLCLWGGIWHEHIVAGTEEDILADARYAFSHAAPGGGYIMGSSHSLAVGAKPSNVLAMKRCRDEWGVYPIRRELFGAS
jgi:uroporphyrinogen decarboxylase